MFINVDLLGLVNRKKYNYKVTKKTSDDEERLISYIFIGALAGLGASLLGIGGGIFIVTLLIFLCKYNVKSAVRTSFFVMMSATIFALLSASTIVTISFSEALPATYGAVVGSLVGLKVIKYIDADVITKYNYIVSLIIGSTMLLRLLN